MKSILFGCLVLLSFISVQGIDDDGVFDLDNDSPSLPHDSSLWFKVEAKYGRSYHPDYDNANLEFVNPGNIFVNDHQYFNIKCKKQCQKGEEYYFFLTENRVQTNHIGEPPNILAYIIEIS